MRRAVTGDGQRRLYQWRLDDPAQWEIWSGGNGQIDGPTVALDAIWFYAPASQPQSILYVDDVHRSPTAGVGLDGESARRRP